MSKSWLCLLKLQMYLKNSICVACIQHVSAAVAVLLVQVLVVKKRQYLHISVRFSGNQCYMFNGDACSLNHAPGEWPVNRFTLQYLSIFKERVIFGYGSLITVRLKRVWRPLPPIAGSICITQNYWQLVGTMIWGAPVLPNLLV